MKVSAPFESCGVQAGAARCAYIRVSAGIFIFVTENCNFFSS